MTPRYPIAAVARLTGIPVDTLRAWERRYRAVEPSRDRRGRSYTEREVERLRLLKAAVDAGHAIGAVAALALPELRRLAARAQRGAAARAAALAPLVAAVQRVDAGGLRLELSRLAAALPARTFCREIALPLLDLVGEAWRAGTLSIAQEHLASAEVRSLLGALARSREVRAGAPRIVLATPAGEQHEIGTLAAAIVTAEAGLGAVYLGPDLPAAEIAAAAARVDAAGVALGWTAAPGAALRAGRAAIAEVAARLPERVELWIGGRGAGEVRRLTGGRALAVADLDVYEAALARVRAR